ncbi:type 1 fimbrial protein [Serratia marcescens]|uniref:fimbrial protein n=1 Tax=Serratia marcescens TaxID=615 RepID=UPI00114E7A3B|nr:fimbrial protein [Serratia marcescens]QDI20296.1 type 1 fimbrial protein [Serratia marcescens]QDI30040.1 type 1 fimbrial protein [Serratia marcescens]QDI44544.1 type 1 fimbrial protein [Serratia marcescens]QDI58969.1 type 1 fimbrial protein [Serratia marcescens]QLJ67561.1 fimbrial protein [Serratia marcescens]
MRKKTILVSTLLLTIVFSSVVAAANDNFKLHGALVAEPCTFQPMDEVDFGNIVDKLLYKYQRTSGKLFQIQLKDCDTNLGKNVKVSFSGPESPQLPGLLAVGGGIAVGLETPAGQALALNAPGLGNPLANGDNTIALRAYIQAEPDAIANKNIKRDVFTASATVTLLYE